MIEFPRLHSVQRSTLVDLYRILSYEYPLSNEPPPPLSKGHSLLSKSLNERPPQISREQKETNKSLQSPAKYI